MSEVMKYTYAELEAEIRVVEQDGEPWFVLTDLAKVLGYRDAANAKRVLRDGQYNTLSVSISADLGFSRGRSPIVINEPGLYRLIMRSNVPNAEKFQDWVTGEVLPTIRKTGAYIDPASALAESVARGDIDTLLELAQASVNAAKEARAELKVARPKAALFDAAMAYEDQGGMPLQNFARCLAAETGWKTRQLLQQFVKDGFLGYDENKSRYFIREGKGELFNSHTGNPLVTMKGVEAICDFYGLKG